MNVGVSSASLKTRSSLLFLAHGALIRQTLANAFHGHRIHCLGLQKV